MRITNNMLITQLRQNLNTNMMRMDEMQRQLATGRKINRPSDNPAGLVTSLRLRSNLIEGEQYLANINEAINFMETTDSAFNNIDDILQKIRQLTVKAATGSNDPDAHWAIAEEIEQLNDQLKMIANTNYGTKHIFSGTNVTEAPYQKGKWVGNQELLQLEIGAGVKMPINLDTKEFFMGRLNNNFINPPSGISEVLAGKLQEGHYEVTTALVDAASLPDDSVALEAQNYLSSVANNGYFFYKEDETPATLGVGSDPAALANDSAYNGSLLIEVKDVKEGIASDGLRASLTNSASGNPAIEFNKPLYQEDNGAGKIASGDLSSHFTYTRADGSTAGITSADYDEATGEISFTLGGAPAAGDTIIWDNNNGKALDENGNEYAPVQMTYDGSNWVYDDFSRITANIKGHIYTKDGDYKYVELLNVSMNMETEDGAELFRISAADINDPAFTEDLVIWNNTGSKLGGIDPVNPQINAGDKTVISFSAAGSLDAQKVKIDHDFTSADHGLIEGKSHNFTFNANTLDNTATELKFFSLNADSGLSYDGSISLEVSQFNNSDLTAGKPKTEFDYQAGVFDYVTDLARKIEAGRLPEIGAGLGGNDIRMNELLLFRATVGAKINRLELQENRLETTGISLTELLSNNEDANIAEVIMDLKMQENVYRSCLGAGSRIIMPTLIDFLR